MRDRERFVLEQADVVWAISEDDARRMLEDVPPLKLAVVHHAGAVAELLKVLLKLVAEREGVASRIIATIDDLEKIAADDDADVPAMRGWRRELFGEYALAVKRGDLALAMSGSGVTTLARRHFAAAAE